MKKTTEKKTLKTLTPKQTTQVKGGNTNKKGGLIPDVGGN